MYTFNITDHLGNVRVVSDYNRNILETNDYYPYGMLMANSSSDYQPFKYSGKELDRMHGLNWYDHGARMSDPALCRWHVVDPLCEKYYDVSPYVMCANDPVNYVDGDGRIPSAVIGAIIGGGADFALQVAEGLRNGQTFTDAVSNVNYGQVMLSAGTGALGVGIATKTKQLLSLTRLAKCSSVVDVVSEGVAGSSTSVIESAVNNEKISAKKVAVEGSVSAFSGKYGKYRQNKLKQTNAYKALKRQADHANRVARGSARQSRVSKAQKLNKKVAEYGNNKTNVESSALNEIITHLIENKKDKK